MNLVPVVLSYSDQPPATAAQLEAATRICTNVALGFERMIGRVMGVAAPVLLHDMRHSTNYGLSSGGLVHQNVSIYADVQESLNHYGYDTERDIYAVWLTGNGRDNSGVGNPTWTQAMYDTGKWGWNARANPLAGGVSVSGMRHLNNVAKLPRSGLTSMQRRVYYHAIWHGLHEIGHALGVMHTGYDRTKYPNGRPTDESLKQASVMAYGWWYYATGNMSTIGALPEELDTWARHTVFLPSNSHYMHLYLPDKKLLLDGYLEANLVLGPGVLMEDYTA